MKVPLLLLILALPASGQEASDYLERWSPDSPATVDRLDEVLAQDPDDSAALSARAAVLFNLGRKQSACRDAKAALRLDPSDQRALGLSKIGCKGKLAPDMKFHDPTKKLRREAERGAGERPPRPGAQKRSGRPARGGGSDLKPKDTSMGTFVGLGGGAQGPVNPQSHFESFEKVREARDLLLKGKFRSAETVAKEALRLNPKNVRAYEFLAGAYRKKGMSKDSLAAAEAGLKFAETDSRLLKLQAHAKIELKDAEGALDAALNAMAVNQTDPMAYVLHARALADLGRRREALDSLVQASALDPRYNALLAQAKRARPDAEPMFYLPGEKMPGKTEEKGSEVGGRLRIIAAFVLIAAGIAAALWMVIFGGKGGDETPEGPKT